jgi:RNA polymerase sigma-70 factor (ECF subfamily)
MDPIDLAIHRTLAVRAQLGERAALEQLFLRHHRALGYYLRRMLSRQDVADVQQEVWLAVIRRIAQLRNPEAFVVWLYKIARRKAVDRVTQWRLDRSGNRADQATELLSEPEPEFSADDAARIHEGLARLGPEHREVLVLRFMEELSYEEIAEVIACGPGTVRSRLHYAKLALREQLETSHERIKPKPAR